MKVIAGQSLVSAAFRKLATLTRFETVLEKVHTIEDLIGLFEALPWDEKVFTLTEEGTTVWVAEVHKEGPTLTLTPNRPDLEGLLRIARWSFWKEFVAALQADHPAFQAPKVETFLERLFSDTISAGRRQALAHAHHEDEALNAHRRQLRQEQHQRKQEWREARADEHRYQYWVWYQ